MAEIIPSINVRTFAEAKEKIELVEPYVKWVHLDVTDGIFSKHETWRDPGDFKNYRSSTSIGMEVHLMVNEPEKIIDEWLVRPVRRVIVHIEAMSDPELIIAKCHKVGVEIGFAVNPGTSWEKLQPWFNKVDMVQTLAVNPGPSGQKMGEDTIDKIRHIRTSCPECIIEVDGGVNQETAKKAIFAGANILVAGNYIFAAENIKGAVAELNVQMGQQNKPFSDYIIGSFCLLLSWGLVSIVWSFEVEYWGEYKGEGVLLVAVMPLVFITLYLLFRDTVVFGKLKGILKKW